MALRQIETTTLPVSDIEIGERLRPADAAAVETMIHSIQRRGLLSPVQVLAVKGSYRLLDGLHRLTAAISMGMPEVPVKIHRCSVREGMNIEVEANLARASLNPLDLGLFLARQKELYEEEHPETKQGAKGSLAASGVQTGKTPVWSFAANAAAKLCKDETTVRRLIAAAKTLSKDEVKQLRAAPKRVRLDDLQVLAKCGEASDRTAICKALATGSAKTAKEALRAVHAKPGEPTVSAADKQSRALNDAFARAGKAARKRFVQEHREELLALLDETAETGDVVLFKARERQAS